MPTSLNWPSTVSQYSDTDQYQEAPERNIVEFHPEVGPPKRRRRTAIATTVYEYAATMSSTDYDTLIAFYRDTCLDGTLTFNRFLPRDPTGAQGSFEFMFMAAPMYRGISGAPHHGQVQISLRKMPGAVAQPAVQPGNMAVTTPPQRQPYPYSSVHQFLAR